MRRFSFNIWRSPRGVLLFVDEVCRGGQLTGKHLSERLFLVPSIFLPRRARLPPLFNSQGSRFSSRKPVTVSPFLILIVCALKPIQRHIGAIPEPLNRTRDLYRAPSGFHACFREGRVNFFAGSPSITALLHGVITRLRVVHPKLPEALDPESSFPSLAL